MAKKSRNASTGKWASQKKGNGSIGRDATWTVVSGALTRRRGRPEKVKSLFKVIGEKIPFSFLDTCRKHLAQEDLPHVGVYIAHDSMGYPRYIGRGNIFGRLAARRKAQPLELAYFSFFVVEDKTHEKEIETIMIRAAGPLLHFNSRKVRVDIEPGSVRDFEQGTKYIERQYKKGRRTATKKASAT